MNSGVTLHPLFSSASTGHLKTLCHYCTHTYTMGTRVTFLRGVVHMHGDEYFTKSHTHRDILQEKGAHWF